MASSSNQKPPILKQLTAQNAVKRKQESNRSGVTASIHSFNRIKTELTSGENSTFRTERLSSIRLPRDLTLGGIPSPRSTTTTANVRPNLVNNKKVYTPNLNAVRNKNT